MATLHKKDTRKLFQPQVRLVPATVPLLNALNEDRTLFCELMGSPVPDGWPEFPEAIGFTLEHLRNAPEADHAWSMQFFVDPATGRLLGSGGFAARPVERAVEIGYESPLSSGVRGSGPRCPGSGRACCRQRRGRSRHRAYAARSERVDGRARVVGL